MITQILYEINFSTDSPAKAIPEEKQIIKEEYTKPIPSLSITPPAPETNPSLSSISKPDTISSSISSTSPNQDTKLKTTTTTTTNYNNSNNNSSVPSFSVSNSSNTVENNDHIDNSNKNNNLTENNNQPQCIKCSNICNNCSYSNITNNITNNNNNNNNSNNSTNGSEGNEFSEECEEEGGVFESQLDCPTPTEEKVIIDFHYNCIRSNLTLQVYELDVVAPDEMAGNKEFFCGNSAKTPERYLKIRNTIVDQWLKHKPKYLSKTAVRTGLKVHLYFVFYY